VENLLPSNFGLPAVDLVINAYERTYRSVLSEGFVSRINGDNGNVFARSVVLLNNILDRSDAHHRALALLESGELHSVFSVNDHLDEALHVTGLSRRDLSTIPHYSDWALAALVLPGADYMVHWDAEVHMSSPCDWVTPSMRLMQEDQRISVANPLWSGGGFSQEERERVGDFCLSYGFSDQVYLIDRREFRNHIYHHWVPISLRYPLAHIAPYFEQMVDAYLRVTRRYRATFLGAQYEHPNSEGASYPSSFRLNALNQLRRGIVAVARRVPMRHPYFHD
jgi:hypothetical protein